MGLVNASFSSNPHTLGSNLAAVNAELAACSPAEIIRWTLAMASNPVISTNFRPGAAALLHMVVRARADIPVIWVDSGYNTPATYRYIEELVGRWGLNLYCYTPRVSAARYAALHGDVPAGGDERFMPFVRDAKLEPFERAFNELKPDFWLTGIRAEQTEQRRALGVVSRGPRNSVRVAPLHSWQEAQVGAYLRAHELPDNDDYVDPTKPGQHSECGLQLLR